MTIKYGLNKCLQFGLTGLLGCLSVSLFTSKIQAQQSNIVPDNTLGAESSQVIDNFQGLPIEIITGGATRQINLFHSFQEFNISEGRGAYFFSPSADIQNILARVTGNNPSEILGRLGTLSSSSPNLFLINPNGIVFGKNASLDVDGSFVGTTANGVQFGNQGIFSATNPQALPLLTVNPSVLLFNQIQASGGIINQSQASAGINLIGQDVTGLRVADGKSLLLVGGNINIDGGGIHAYGGNVELAGLAALGNVGLNIAGDNLGLVIPENAERADISLSNGAEVNVRGADGGNIKIQARNVNLAGQSKLRAGIDIGLGTPNSQGGDITINATAETTLIDQSFIANVVQERAFGNTGDINIATGTLTLNNGGQINASLFGQGNAGNVNINAQGTVTVTGKKDNFISGIFSDVLTEATGNGGDINIKSSSFTLSNEAYLSTNISGQGNGGEINITAGSLSLTDSSQIQSTVEGADGELPGGRGNAGNININVQGDISFRNSRLGETNGIVSEVGEGAIGNGANVTINTNSLEINDGSEIQGSTRGKGDSGNITINARNNISLDGRNGDIFSRIINAVQSTAEGNAGNIQITTGTLKATNGAFINSTTDSKGNAGNISINAFDNIDFDSNSYISSSVYIQGVGDGGNIYLKTGSLSLTNGGRVSTNILGKGNAGNITVEASENVKLDNLDYDAFSGLQSNLEIAGVGKAGNIQVTTASLSVNNGAIISSYAAGNGNAGNITINARENATFSGFGSTIKSGSGVLSFVSDNAIGNGGDIRIIAGNLLLKDGGRLNASGGRQGNGGNIFLDVGNTIAIDGVAGSGLPSSVNTEAFNGNAGNIQIKTGSLFLTNGGRISSSLFEGNGNGGNITINARDTVIIDGVLKDVTYNIGDLIGKIDIKSGLFSSLLNGQGKGGDIEITTGSFSLTNGAYISGETNGRGNGGNITINARDTVTLDRGESGSSTYVSTSALTDNISNAGDIRINARELFIKNGATLAAFGSDEGNGGNIQVKAGTLRLTNGGIIITAANRNAGNINIDTSDAVIIDGISGAFSFLSTGGVGKGGDIQITTDSLTLSNGGQLAATSFGQGNAGDIIVNADNAISIDGVGSNGRLSGAFTTLEGEAEGRGGNISLTTGSLFLTNGGVVNGSTFSKGDGGNITIDARDRILIDGVSTTGFASGVFSTVSPVAVGNGGNINLTTDSLFLNNGGISSSSLGEGKGGDINISSGFTALDNKAFIGAITNSGDGGNINLTASDRLLLRNGSQISTTAGTAQSGGDGGNIDIDSRFIIAITQENSDITANAFTGTGGKVEINSQGIFGIESRTKPTEKSDITASSEQGVSGVININAPDTSSIQNSFTELPPVIDTNALIANSCISRGTKRQENSFTITGSGAITTNRPGVLVSNYTTGEVRGVETTSRPWKKGDPIIEPQGLYRLNNGQLLLSRECSN
ncbi:MULTISPECIES: beta strand repeat-containing protein [Nostoc]|uniref:Filamentous hemagglutinin N-terminal domain-containing protein n=2 Tax=Nostoc TaxID=1177 RepID=A0ABR8IHR8_9NOSO|nr:MULTISPECIES: filamentous hemagglutinin N-terminal domain-containing protein [Nostoc]MBD2565246.1 filamentous hemagglutinin N-terminal domain-containing protein [Nostoc linckia FACHB-391]MBD2650387.1 filamentous hemagglutinin N-terminal domain-containing protein [Nostoc foliaceum FACHB-393]